MKNSKAKRTRRKNLHTRPNNGAWKQISAGAIKRWHHRFHRMVVEYNKAQEGK